MKITLVSSGSWLISWSVSEAWVLDLFKFSIWMSWILIFCFDSIIFAWSSANAAFSSMSGAAIIYSGNITIFVLLNIKEGKRFLFLKVHNVLVWVALIRFLLKSGIWMPSFKKEITVKEGQIIFRIWIVPRQKAEEQHRRWEFFLFSHNFCFTPLQSIWTPTLGKRHLNSYTGS